MLYYGVLKPRQKKTTVNDNEDFFEKIYRECKDIIICPECGRIWMQKNNNEYLAYVKEYFPDPPAENERLSWINALRRWF